MEGCQSVPYIQENKFKPTKNRFNDCDVLLLGFVDIGKVKEEADDARKKEV